RGRAERNRKPVALPFSVPVARQARTAPAASTASCAGRSRIRYVGGSISLVQLVEGACHRLQLGGGQCFQAARLDFVEDPEQALERLLARCRQDELIAPAVSRALLPDDPSALFEVVDEGNHRGSM